MDAVALKPGVAVKTLHYGDAGPTGMEAFRPSRQTGVTFQKPFQNPVQGADFAVIVLVVGEHGGELRQAEGGWCDTVSC